MRRLPLLNGIRSLTDCLFLNSKANRLEIYAQSPDGLSLQHSKAIYGKVTMLHKLRPASSRTDHIFVGTDRFMYFTLSWNLMKNQLQTERAYVDLADKTSRDSQTGDRCHLDPSGRFMTLELLEGVVTVIPIVQKTKKKQGIEIGSLGEPVQSRIEELAVRSSAFLQRLAPPQGKPRLALLYQDCHDKVRLKVREVNYTAGATAEDAGSVELDAIDTTTEELEFGAKHLIPISEPAYGLLVLGETSIAYYDETTNQLTTRALEEATIFVAWEQIDNQRFVLADDYGRLYLLMLVLGDENTVKDWKLDVLGETSHSSTLVYLDAGHIFVGSHQGDSQVIRITERSMEVVQTFANVAPILDFAVMDMGNRSDEGQNNEFSSGQARIVTGSGAYKDGSLRSVRSGVGLQDLGVLGDMGHITNMFSLKSNSSSPFFDVLVVSSIDETRVFRFGSDGDVEEVDQFKGLTLSDSTLLASNLPHNRLLQVTSSAVRIIEVESGVVVDDWTPAEGRSITAVAGNERHAVLSVGGVELVILDVSDGIKEHARKSFGSDSQIACVTLSMAHDRVAIVGFWQNSTIAIVNIDTLQAVQTVIIAEDGLSVPRSLLLTNLFDDQPPTLFVAMADGNVVTFSVDPQTHALSGKKSIVLGTQQASFRSIPRGDGNFSVFAICEHPSLIYGSEGRIVYSAVTAEKATCVCPFESEFYSGGDGRPAIAIATAEDLRIAVVDTERTTHVQTLLLNETVRRIQYSPSLKAFGLGTIKRTLANAVETVQSHFKLADEILFKELNSYALNEEELVESVMRAELDDGTGSLAERFVVGTSYLEDDTGDAVRGRIIVFEVTEDRKLKAVTELAVKGACRCLAMCEGRIVAALTKTVVVYNFYYEAPSRPFLTKEASYRTSTAPMDMSVAGNQIAIADLMKSVSIVQFKRGEAGAPSTLEEVAKHLEVAWGTAVAEVAEDTYLESDAEGNLMVLYREPRGVTEEDRRRLKVSSEMRLGEMVNRIRRVDVHTQPDAAVAPKAFMATVSMLLTISAIHLAAAAPRLK